MGCRTVIAVVVAGVLVGTAARLLSKAGAPAGSTALPSQAGLLNQITFKALKP